MDTVYGAASRRVKPSARRIEDRGEARRRMRTENELLEHAESFLGADPGPTQLLHVDVARVHRIQVGEGPGDTVGDLFTLPHAMAPLGVEISEATHLERQQGLERHHERLAVVWGEADLGGGGTSRPGLPPDAMVDRAHRLGRALV